MVLNKMRRVLLGLVAFIALTLFSTPAFAYYRSPVDFSDDKYLRFGNADYPQFEDNGLSLEIDHSSISHTLVNLQMYMWGPMIAQRHISHFLLLANGKVIEEFRPEIIEKSDGSYAYSNVYYIKSSTPELIGTRSYFQVVAVERVADGSQYIVAWSGITEEITLKDLPVKDRESIGVLLAILEKLKDLANLLAQMLQELKELTRPTPQKLDQLYSAVNGLMDKTPMKQVAKELEKVNNKIEESRRNLQKPGSKLQLGGLVDLLPTHPGLGVFYLFDLTKWKDQVLLLRTIEQAAFWVFFFHMIFKWVTPRPGV